MIQKNRFHQFLVQVPLLSITKKYTTFYQPRVFNFRDTDLMTYNYCSITLFDLWWRLLAWLCWNSCLHVFSWFVRVQRPGSSCEKVNFDRKIDDHDVGDLIDDTAKGRASFLSTSFVFLYPKASMIWRWETRGWWLWSCGQEGGRASLLFASSAMHSIAFDVQSTGSLLISMMDNSILLINIIFIISIMWPLPGIPLGRRAGHDWVFCCWRANEESHETICGGFVTFLGVRVRCWHICTSWQQNFYVGVKYHFILAFTLWMELWD